MDKRNILAFYVFIIAHYKGNVNHIDVNFVKKNVIKEKEIVTRKEAMKL